MTEKEGKYSNFRIAVPADYEEVFSLFYYAENRSAETITKTFLPSYQTILIFNFGAKAILESKENTQLKVNKSLVLGPIKHAFNYSLPTGSAILVANFNGDAFYRFFGNASVAKHLPIDPDNLLNENCFTALWGELDKIDNPNLRVSYILDFCRPYLKPRNVIMERLTNFTNNTLNPIKLVAVQQNQTERNVQLNHKKYLGYTAKEINRHRRFIKAIELIQDIALKSAKIDWFEIISACDYYDQSQLIHDFKHYINLSPTKYLRFQEEICNAKSD
ncbi:helix-turn-helix domain-containing protein [Chryseobacterium ginsenosidimutans]|uniref:helix-turn-helix domain-containing protein n=1 Tax=Chryseobacterium ginsenosidimutans TaxID=687846 RepID=UPI0027B88249|nr:helix-turn-helix domain-containing protein [Chryseobacterium ginsenosidimutans]